MEDTKIIYVSVGGDVLSFELDKPADMNEDAFYKYVCNYVFSNISIDIQ